MKSRLAVRELETYEATALSEYPEGGGEAEVPGDAVDRLPEIAAQVLARFRGMIRANPRVTQLGPTGTLPDFCIESAAIIARVGLVGLNPVPEGMTDPRRDEYRNAEKFLESLRGMEASAFLDDETPAAGANVAPAFGGNPLLRF
ncbi:hypothetical protein [Luteolibacter marinus]|uniref:hypothetical protein n=1 Tax=Luteolibacter marinus TaxID=2776705 RepID=UPI001865E6C8|nr:hypothetical protein [Luteolibacter marinus]